LPANNQGEYLVAYDPLDGSSLVDVDLSVGSICWNMTKADTLRETYIVASV